MAIELIPVIIAQDLYKTYRSKITGELIPALRGVSLEVEKGKIFTILGPNGAGKTTLINCLSLLLQPEKGKIKIFGQQVLDSQEPIKNRINMSSGNANFSWCLTVKELLRFYGYLYGLCGTNLNQRIKELIEILDLSPFLDRRFDELSTGSKQKLALAKALINAPELLFLDEPTIGLDVDIAKKIRSFIVRLNKEKQMTILLTTHYMAEAEELSHRIAFLHSGQIKLIGTPAELKEKFSAKNMEEVFLQLSHSYPYPHSLPQGERLKGEEFPP